MMKIKKKAFVLL